MEYRTCRFATRHGGHPGKPKDIAAAAFWANAHPSQVFVSDSRTRGSQSPIAIIGHIQENWENLQARIMQMI
jgi:hypothetical protein